MKGTVLGHDHKYDIHCTHLITATLKPTEKVIHVGYHSHDIN